MNLMMYSKVNQPTKMASATEKAQCSSSSSPSPRNSGSIFLFCPKINQENCQTAYKKSRCYKKFTWNIGRVEMINANVDATTNKQDITATTWKKEKEIKVVFYSQSFCIKCSELNYFWGFTTFPREHISYKLSCPYILAVGSIIPTFIHFQLNFSLTFPTVSTNLFPYSYPVCL